MAKRTNILRIIREEIKKGNTYVAKNGNFVSADMLNRDILAEFKRCLDNGEVDMTTSFVEFKSLKLDQYTTAVDVLDGICEAFHLINDDPNVAELTENPREPEINPPKDSEQLPSTPDDSEEILKPKRRKTKDGDAK